MYLLVSILAVIVSIVLIFFVVIQNSKGGGLAAGFSSSNQVMGVRKTTDFLEKATWSLAGTIVVLSITASFLLSHQSTTNRDSSIKDEIQNAVPANPNAVPDFGTAVPGQDKGNGQQTTAPATQQSPAPVPVQPATAPVTTPKPTK